MQLGATDAFTDLVLHVLAHVPVPGPENLFDPRYVAWSEAHLPAELATRLREDAELIASAWPGGDGLAIQAWPELHRDLAEFVRTRARALADLGPGEVARPHVLARLQACAPVLVELVHAQLALLAPAFARLHADTIAPAVAAALPAVEGALRQAIAVAPGLATRRIELAWPLGPRGRGFADRIVVGAPAPWHDLDPAGAAVLALHEHAVQRAPVRDHVLAEWTALVEVAAAVARASESLRAAHARWIAALDLAALVDALVQRQAITTAVAAALQARDTRVEVLVLSARPAGAARPGG